MSEGGLKCRKWILLSLTFVAMIVQIIFLVIAVFSFNDLRDSPVYPGDDMYETKVILNLIVLPYYLTLCHVRQNNHKGN